MTKNIDILTRALAGKYTIKHQIAAGGMGAIFLGEHQILKKRVAIKIVNKDLSEDEEFRKRFFREAKLAANLVHPNIIDIYDFGNIEGIDYIIMQYVEGRNLKEILDKEGRLPLSKCIKYMQSLTEAIAFAHNHGIIHRDIKPSNLIIDANDHIYLTDFGISKDLSDIDLTTIESVLGSPKYMSPEQKKGAPTDNRSDLFSLGIVFYEMITGLHPFGGKSASGITFEEINEQPKLPNQLDPKVPFPLSRIIRHMLKINPEHRFQNADQLVKEFEVFFANQPGKAGFLGLNKILTGHRQKNSINRRLSVLFLIGAFMIGLSLSLFYYFRWSDPAKRTPNITEEKISNISRSGPKISNEVRYRILIKEIDELGGKNHAGYIKLWTNQNTYQKGEKIIYCFQSSQDGFATVFSKTTEGTLIQIFPNKFHPNTKILAHQIYTIPNPSAGIRLEIEGPPGSEEMIFITGDEPFQILTENYADRFFAEVKADEVSTLEQIKKNIQYCKKLDLKQKRISYQIRGKENDHADK